jgi:general secretion pathway protein G
MTTVVRGSISTPGTASAGELPDTPAWRKAKVKTPRRRRHVVVKNFQIYYLLWNMAFLCVGVAGWVGLVFGPLVVKLLSPVTPERDLTELATIFLSLHSTAWFGFAAFVIVMAVHLLVQSHRVAGPMVRFSHVFEELRRGNLSMRVILRRRDYLHDEAAALDRALRAVRRRIGVVQGRAHRTDEALAALRVAIAGGVRTQVDLALQNVVREAARTRTHLDTFKTASPVECRNPPSVRAGPRTSAAGFTLIELLIVTAITGTVAAMAIPAYSMALDRARVVRTIADVRSIGKTMEVAELLEGVLPTSLAQAGLADLVDPYGQPYVYLVIAGTTGKGGLRKDRKLNPINSKFDLYSMGKDGVSKTQLTNKESLDDIVWANDGGFVGLAEDF